jgi:basic amino acid/polyamine antiporter, APA family
VPAIALIVQAVWCVLLVLPRIRLRDASGAPLLDAAGLPQYGNLYSNLLDYVVSSVLIFYALTLLGLFVLRRRHPDLPRPSRAFGYPLVPLMYMLVATAIVAVLLVYKTQSTWPGLVVVLSGVPVYWVWRRWAPRPSDAAFG